VVLSFAAPPSRSRAIRSRCARRPCFRQVRVAQPRAPPEGRAWYKTTVEAYLRHEGDERLSVLGKLAPSRFARSLTS
jgi:hypothetical protein